MSVRHQVSASPLHNGRPLSLFGLFMLQCRVIGALLFREMNTRYGRENIGFLWVIGEPILFCAGVSIVWTAIRDSHEHNLPTTAIVLTGYVPLTMWRHSLARAVFAFQSNGSLLFHRQVTPLDIILARTILEITGALGAGFLVFLGAWLLGYIEPPKDYGMLYLGLGFHCLFCVATALLVAALSEVSELVEKSIGILSYLSLPFSGAFMMVDWLPPRWQNAILLSPSVDNIEMIRAGQFGDSAHAHYDIFYDSWITFVLFLIGLSLTLRARRHIVVQ
ncbi:ABC transporter permease [Nguyenibacter vanlangensis]|uniref:ABC transporter permease n=1 Tax=Nguyenibacter vanlangensis TaxID=1216886 RepID=A0ABZ3D865_9PROT